LFCLYEAATNEKKVSSKSKSELTAFCTYSHHQVTQSIISWQRTMSRFFWRFYKIMCTLR